MFGHNSWAEEVGQPQVLPWPDCALVMMSVGEVG